MPQAATMPAKVDVRAPPEQEEGSQSRVLRWLKGVGEAVVKDEPLLEVETDKVTVEIAAPSSGVLAEILKPEQQEIAAGDLLARISAGDAAGRSGETSVEAPADAPTEASVPAGERAARERLSPAVRRLLAEHAIDPAAVHGSGEGGRLTVDDVLKYAHERRTGRSASRQSADVQAREARADVGDLAETVSTSGGASAISGRLVPHSPIRRRIAEHMVRSLLHTAPHVTTVFEADFSAVLAHRARHRDALAREGVPLTLTAYILAACVDAIRAVPEANARWTPDALELLDEINIGVGTAVEDRGLIVPVVHGVPALDLSGIARELGRLVSLAREDRLAPADVRGGTFTISNHGVSGSLIAAPIVINQPQVAILGVGKVQKRPVVLEQDGEERIAARLRGYLTLTIDHRVMDGHRANRFLEVLVKRLESWPAH